MIGISKYIKRAIKDYFINRGRGKNVMLEEHVSFRGEVDIYPNVSIGKYTNISSGTIYPNVRIGRYCSFSTQIVIGANAHPQDWLSTHPFQYGRALSLDLNNEFTIIGNDVWVGANTVIKNGVTIGDGVIIGAGAVVTKNIPPYAIAAGVPAKILRYRFEEDVIQDLLRLKWWDMDEIQIKKLPFKDVKKCIEILKQTSNA